MKIQKFIAATTQQAMLDIHQVFGAEALIFSNQKTPNGVEVLAGIAHDTDRNDSVIGRQEPMLSEFADDINTNEKRSNESIEQYVTSACDSVIEVINKKMQTFDGKLSEITKNMLDKFSGKFQSDSGESINLRNELYQTLLRCGFLSKFIEKFSNEMLHSEYFTKGINQNNLIASLSSYLKVDDDEIITKKGIFALIGPTGAGKTTTIAKLSARYVLQYGAESLGLISTDFNYFKNKANLLEYAKLLKVDLEYAQTANDVGLALHAFSNKKLILIDTFGVGVRDSSTLNNLLNILNPHKDEISPYLVMPCNIQEYILNEIISTMGSTEISGCILTKQDECFCLATTLSVLMYYKLSLAYICNGQKISRDICVANKNKILEDLISIDSKEIYDDIIAQPSLA